MLISWHMVNGLKRVVLLGKPMTHDDRVLVAGVMRDLLKEVDVYINGFIAGTNTGEVLNLNSIDSTRKAAVNAIHLVTNTLAQNYLRPEHYRQFADRVFLLRELSIRPELFTMMVKWCKSYLLTKKGDFMIDKKTCNDFSFLADIDKHYIKVAGSTITFQIQDGPRKMFGVNGCQVDAIGEAFLRIIENFDSQFPCVENKAAVANIKSAIGWLEKRTNRRVITGIEGTNKEVTTP
jgi:hypothetical protein